jgi:hypothetical protein
MFPPGARLELAPADGPVREPVIKVGGQPVWLEEPQWPLSSTTGEPMPGLCDRADAGRGPLGVYRPSAAVGGEQHIRIPRRPRGGAGLDTRGAISGRGLGAGDSAHVRTVGPAPARGADGRWGDGGNRAVLLRLGAKRVGSRLGLRLAGRQGGPLPVGLRLNVSSTRKRTLGGRTAVSPRGHGCALRG